MKVGLMADTHDRIDAVERAIDFFNRAGVEHVLHAGDLVSPFVAPKFAKLNAKLHYVWGNNEGDRELVRVKFGEMDVKPLGNFAALELGGRKIALLHGTHEEIVGALLKSGTFDVIVRGHTHRAEVREGKTLLINPGEVCGYLGGRLTVAMLDLDELSAEILEL
ncbi:MAG: metallophosphoesterase [Candidatus Hadarchaeaceae archaeon]